MKMPALFIGHGTPMNAIDHNKFTQEWSRLGKRYEPKGIIMISAHWYTRGLYTQNEEHPEKINDMGGFPKELYDLEYPVKGSQTIANEIMAKLGSKVTIDNSWGIDHGAWSVLTHMYPSADIPVVQISVDRSKSPQEQFEIGQDIRAMREHGYMIIASGNIVHNLRKISPKSDEPYPWAKMFDDYIEDAVLSRQFEKCVNYLDFGEASTLSVPTPDHFYPLLCLLGTVFPTDDISLFNKDYVMGSLSMTGYVFDS